MNDRLVLFLKAANRTGLISPGWAVWMLEVLSWSQHKQCKRLQGLWVCSAAPCTTPGKQTATSRKGTCRCVKSLHFRLGGGRGEWTTHHQNAMSWETGFFWLRDAKSASKLAELSNSMTSSLVRIWRHWSCSFLWWHAPCMALSFRSESSGYVTVPLTLMADRQRVHRLLVCGQRNGSRWTGTGTAFDGFA